MKPGHCRKCKKCDVCKKIKDCPLVRAEMKRIERGRHKKNPEVIYLHDLTELEAQRLEKIIYGDSETN